MRRSTVLSDIRTINLTILKSAKEHLEKNGWTQGEFHLETGESCLMGAIGVGMGGLPIPLHLKSHCSQILEGVGVRKPTEWNDTPGRTKEQVLELLDKAIEWEKTHEHPLEV